MPSSWSVKAIAAFLSLIAVSVSSPSPVGARSSLKDNASLFLTNVTAINSTVPQLSKEQMHSNVMKHWPTERIINSTQLAEIHRDPASQPQLLNTTLYVSDWGNWSSVDIPSNDTLARRTNDPCYCSTGGRYNIDWTYSYWAPWQHLTSCVSTYGGSSGAEITYGQDHTTGVTYGGGIDVGAFEGMFSAGFGYDVSFDNTISEQYSCYVTPPEYQGQIWGRQLVAWAEVTQGSCDDCGVCGTTCDNTITWMEAPYDTNIGSTWVQFGCSSAPGSPLVGC